MIILVISCLLSGLQYTAVQLACAAQALRTLIRQAAALNSVRDLFRCLVMVKSALRRTPRRIASCVGIAASSSTMEA